MSNEIDERFAAWLSYCYDKTADKMPESQRQQLENAFYAGVVAGAKCKSSADYERAMDAHCARVGVVIEQEKVH